MHRFGVAGSAARLYGALVSGIIPTPRCDGDCNASVAAEGDSTAVQRGGAFCRAGRRAASLDRLRRPRGRAAGRSDPTHRDDGGPALLSRLRRPRKRESGAIRPHPSG